MPSTRLKTRALGLLLLLGLSGCAPDSPRSAEDTAITDAQARVENGLLPGVVFEGEDAARSVMDRMAHHRVPGLSFALIDDGEIAWAAGYGVRDEASGAPVGPETLFQAASIAKPVVAAAVMRMRDAGVLELDRDVQDYLTEYEIPAGAQSPENPVTLRELLSHTAGITPGGYLGYEAGEPIPTDLEILRGAPPANSPGVGVDFEPGTQVAYSGGGYTLAEVAIQDVTGDAFAAAMDRWALDPMGMENSTYTQPLPAELTNRAASGHTTDGAVLPGRWRVHPEQAAAGLWTTATDLAAFAIAVRDAWLADGGVMARSSAIELLTEQMAGEGIGFVIRGEGDTLVFSHAGGNLGFRAFMIMHVATGDGAVFLTNGDQGMSVGLGMLRAASAVYAWPDYKPDVMRRVEVEPETLAGMVGTYEFANELQVSIGMTDSEDGLTITFPNGDLYELVAIGEQEFISPESGLRVEFGGTEERRTVVVYGDEAVRIEG